MKGCNAYWTCLNTIIITKQTDQARSLREYIEVDETTRSFRGKINIIESINELSFINKKLNSTYYEFSMNSALNKIIKNTLTILLKESTIKKHKRGIKNILLYFRDVDTIDTNNINCQIRMIEIIRTIGWLFESLNK